MSPAKRTGLILVAIIVAMLVAVLVWMIPEALRISRDRDRRLAEARKGVDMARIAAGGNTMGSNDGPAEERPLHDIKVSEVWMDTTEVTNEQFAKFVAATKYVTTAEKAGGSWTFEPAETWKKWTPGASWRDAKNPKHPVVHVSHDDATAFAKWSGKRLPTEAEWEYAARGGVILNPYPWGREASPSGMHPANSWQGTFPATDEGSDGFRGIAPVGSFAANGYGIQDMAGNVAEWCSDWFSASYYAELRPNPDRAAHRNPPGPDVSSEATWKRVVRGGSWLSPDADFRVSARGRETPDFTAAWIGFRCVRDVAN